MRKAMNPEQTAPPRGPQVIGKTLCIAEPFTLESGDVLRNVRVAYETYGALNAEGTNAVLVCHALTGSAHAGDLEGEDSTGWWNGIIGSGRGLDTDRDYVVCSNILGSCYGTTGPLSTDPSTGKRYAAAFPAVTVRDIVALQHALLRRLGVRQLKAVIGGSLGGMQVLEWGIMYPDFVRSLIPIATAAKHSAWCIGFDEAQRLAIMNDPLWNGGAYDEQPAQGLAIARMIAMISYRSRESFEVRFNRDTVADIKVQLHLFEDEPYRYQVESYLRYQGEKLVDRFDANTYITLTRAMDAHDVGRGRSTVKEALGSIRARTLCVGITSDILYPPDEQEEIAASIPGAQYAAIDAPHGHDSFLIEFEQLNVLLRKFLG